MLTLKVSACRPTPLKGSYHNSPLHLSHPSGPWQTTEEVFDFLIVWKILV